MANFRFIKISLLFLSILFVFSCEGDLQDQQPARIVIDEGSSIQNRMVYDDEDSLISIGEDQGDGSVANRNRRGREAWTLTYEGSIAPPQFEGKTLQSTHITIDDNFAYVSYNYKGSNYLGAYDIVDIRKPEKAELTKSVIFADADINGLAIDEKNKRLMLATGTGDFKTGQTSVVELMDVAGDQVSTATTRIGLPGFVATDVKANKDRVFALSGDNAGLSVFENESFELEKFVELDDARALQIENNEAIVMQGTPARLSYFDLDDLELKRTFTYEGANIPESKSSFITYKDDFVILAVGKEGVIVSDYETGEVTDVIPLESDYNGAVSNAVAEDKDLIFIANGEAGVGLAAFDKKEGTVEWIGKANFKTKESANFVVAHKGWVFIARGAAGVQILKVDKIQRGGGDNNVDF